MNNMMLKMLHNKQHCNTGQNQLTDESGKYCCDTISISFMVLSVCCTLREMSAASFFRVSRVVMTESSSRICPFESFNTCSRFFSSCLSRSWNSPMSEGQKIHYGDLRCNTVTRI